MTQTQKTLKKNEKEVTIPKTLEKTIIHPTKTAKKTVKIAEEKNRIEDEGSEPNLMAEYF